MIESMHVAFADLPLHRTAQYPLSAPQDLRWAGICVLAPADVWDLPGDGRHDLYVLRGCVLEQGLRRPAGSFFSRGHAQQLTADTLGAVLLYYRDCMNPGGGNDTCDSESVHWHPGRIPGLEVAELSSFTHRVALVAWRAGTRAAWHQHPRGEEIFVINGELRDERGSYPAGAWLRYHPGAGHAPFVLQDSLILLRNGHLAP